MRRRTRFLIILLAITATLLTTFALWRGLAGKKTVETAVAVRMMKTEGMVTVTNNSARKLTVMENMRMYNGYYTSTGEESYAWVNLDDDKLAKLDAVSQMELRKDGKKLQILVHEGALFFNVKEPLGDEEMMDVCTATMVAGIRGTCGWIQEIDSMNTELCILEGETQCTVTNPVTGERKTSVVSSGEIARFWWNEEEGTCGVDIRKAEWEDIPGFVLKELVGDTGLLEKIFRLSGIDLRNLGDEDAESRLEIDWADTARQLKQIEESDSGKRGISKDPVWKEWSGGIDEETQPNAENSEEPVTEAATEPDTENSEESVTVPETEQETEPDTENSEEPVTEPETEQETEPDTENSEEPVTEPETEQETEPDTENNEEPVTVPETEPKIYTVTYMLDGEQIGEVETYEYGAKVSIRAKAVKPGYTVTDWSRTKDFTMPAENVVITASSTINSYTVTYMLDGEQMGEVETYEYGAKVSVRAKAVKPGYTVTDWSRTKDFTMPAEDVVITATSKIIKYTITFNANGGTLTGSGKVTADYNTTVTLPEPTRTGYNFLGWFTEKENGIQFTVDTAVTEDYVLYAHWKAAKAIIQFDANGGSNAPMGITGVTDELIIDTFPSGVPTRAGYEFAGWNSKKDGSGEKIEAYPTKFPAGTTTYYAKWNYLTGDFTVLGGTPEKDYRYSDTDKKLTILTATPVSISGTTTKDSIEVAESVAEAKVTLSGVNINLNNLDCNKHSAFDILGQAGATITLEGDNILTVVGGSGAALDKYGTGTLTIRGSGSLTAEGYTGIGYGNIIIESGTIHAKGSASGAGIGGGYCSNGSNITIRGGNVTAVGGDAAAGIGGGSNIPGGNGSDPFGRGEHIAISGGVVTAIGGSYGGAGIGGGYYGGSGIDISITGGVVTATGGGKAAGIGGGANQGDSTAKGGDGKNISITGGIVKATAGEESASVIGGGYGTGQNGASENVTLTGGIIFQGTSGRVYGEVTLDSDLEIKAGETLYIPSDAKLIIPEGVTLTNNGAITYEADALGEAISGNLENKGTVSGPGQPQGNSETGEVATQRIMLRKKEEWMSLLNTEED